MLDTFTATIAGCAIGTLGAQGAMAAIDAVCELLRRYRWMREERAVLIERAKGQQRHELRRLCEIYNTTPFEAQKPGLLESIDKLSKELEQIS
jgi:hypothetical protein